MSNRGLFRAPLASDSSTVSFSYQPHFFFFFCFVRKFGFFPCRRSVVISLFPPLFLESIFPTGFLFDTKLLIWAWVVSPVSRNEIKCLRRNQKDNLGTTMSLLSCLFPLDAACIQMEAQFPSGTISRVLRLSPSRPGYPPFFPHCSKVQCN